MSAILSLIGFIAALTFLGFYLWTLLHLLRNQQLDSLHKFLWLIGIVWTFGIAYYWVIIRSEHIN